LKARNYGLDCIVAGLLFAGAAICNAADKATYVVVGDAIAEPLQGMIGDASRGRALVANRQVGLCLLCHAAPIPEERFQGNLSLNLAGVGSRATAGQLRLRLVDAKQLNPQTIMPSYYRAVNLTRVSPAFQERTIFTAQQIEDVVAYLLTLLDDKKSDDKSK
jgi:L-cysteine S-thiosulfotransferase